MLQSLLEAQHSFDLGIWNKTFYMALILIIHIQANDWKGKSTLMILGAAELIIMVLKNRHLHSLDLLKESNQAIQGEFRLSLNLIRIPDQYWASLATTIETWVKIGFSKSIKKKGFSPLKKRKLSFKLEKRIEHLKLKRIGFHVRKV